MFRSWYRVLRLLIADLPKSQTLSTNASKTSLETLVSVDLALARLAILPNIDPPNQP